MWPQAGASSNTGWDAGNGGSSGAQDWASYYQAMPTSQVDWGSLAQQWISMKAENTNVPTLYGDEIEAPPPAPGEEQFIPQQSNRMTPYNQWPPMHLPPPILHTHEIVKQDIQHPPLPHAPPLPAMPHPNSQPEGGLADMDMDEDDETADTSITNNDWSSGMSHEQSINKNFKQSEQYYGKTNPDSNAEVKKSNARAGYQQQSFGGPSPHPPGGGWIHKGTQSIGRGRGNTNVNPIPSLMGAQINMSTNISEYAPPGIMGSIANLDAAARKKLPPWIREGLEKMEREKQKKEDELLRKKLREDKLRKRREEELKMAEKRKENPGLSKFDAMDSNSESDDNETEQYAGISGISDNASSKNIDTLDKDSNLHGKGDISNTSQRKRPSRFDEQGPAASDFSDHEHNTDGDKINAKKAPQKHFTKEEILEEMSLILKRTLTEILLDVTTEEIESTAKESLASAQRQRSKSVVNAKIRANRAFKKNPISSLGLTGYGSGSDNSDSDAEKSERSDEETSNSESDDGLEERLNQRKRLFERTESTILDDCADLEKDLKRREKIWKEQENSSERKRHGSKNSNQSDPSDNSKSNNVKTFEKISAAVHNPSGVNGSNKMNVETTNSKETKISKNEKYLYSPTHSKTSYTGNTDKPNFESGNSSDNASDITQNAPQVPSSKEERNHHDKFGQISPRHATKEKTDSRSRRRDRSTSRDSKVNEQEREASKSGSIKTRECIRNDEKRDKGSNKTKRRSSSREKHKSKKKSRSRSPRSTKHSRRSRTRSRSRNRSKKKHSHSKRSRSRSREKKSSTYEPKSSSRRHRSRSREKQTSRRSRSRSKEKRSRKRNSSTSSETSTFSHASEKRRDNRDSDISSSSRRVRRRSRS